MNMIMHQNFPASSNFTWSDVLLLRNCIYQVITLQGGSSYLNLCQAEGFRHQRCLFIFCRELIGLKFSSNIMYS